MASGRAPALYTREVLAMAVELANHPFRPDATAHGSARSRSCGSTIELSSQSPDALHDVGMKVSACAIGQASAAIFASESAGMDAPAISDTIDALQGWLEDREASSILPRLELLEPARQHPGRHEAILLPWRAALDALSNDRTGR